MLLVLAPSNLGLRPLRPGHEPGAWRASECLRAAGLCDALGVRDPVVLTRLPYVADAQPGTRLGNGHGMRAFNLGLADVVAGAGQRNRFVLVVGGDCSVLLGALAGARRDGPLALIHLDGHSDFRHPGNYDPQRTVSGVAGMDLALATGRGERLGTDWPGVTTPLVKDAAVLQIGERESRNADFAYADLEETAIERIDVFEARAIGVARIGQRIEAMLVRVPVRRFWIHLDLDVLDEAVMPAVDCPGSPGIAPDDLVRIVQTLVIDPGCVGMTVTSFDPDLDPDAQYAALVVGMLRRLTFRSSLSSASSKGTGPHE